MKKYFIKDTSVNGIDDDLFNYADLSKVLERILESNEPPYNIAVIGKWGLGKSSLINLVKNKLGVGGTYFIQEINAWKYEKESLRRVFLKQLWQGISGEKLKSFQAIQQIFSDLISNDMVEENPSQKKSTCDSFKKRCVKIGRYLWRYALPALWIVLFTIAAFIVYKIIQADIENTDINALFWKKTFLSYCKNIGTTLLLPVLIALLTALHSEYKKKETKRFELNFPLETADDYELFLEKAIAEKLKNNSKLKIVTIIDDLDRLSLYKIVEALDSIKAFVNLPNCVFIVPFDDEIIKSALEKRREKEFGENCEVIESELILDKLFQFRIYLPPLLKYDISDYTIKLIEREIPDFIKDYCAQEIMTHLVKRIIIHSDVTTPRQVKKLINAFVNNYLVAREREESGRVEKGLLTGSRGIEQLAKLSVLQADFNHFFDALFIDFSYMERFLQIIQNQSKKNDVPLKLQLYFKYDKEGACDGVVPAHEPLLNFLNRTAKYSVDNIAPFMYLAQDAIGIKTGDEYQRRTIAALESGNSATLKALFTEKPETAEVVISYVTDCMEPELPLQASYPILAMTDEKHVVRLANALVERSIEEDVDMNGLYILPPESLLLASNHVEREEYGRKLLENYLKIVSSSNVTNSTNRNVIINALKVFIPEYKSLSHISQEAVKRTSNMCCLEDEVSVDLILPLLDYSDAAIFAILWGVELLNKLCEHIINENDYRVELFVALQKSVHALQGYAELPKIVTCTMPLFKLPPLLGVLNDIFDEKLCAELDESQSTEIANELILHDYNVESELTQSVHQLLSKLQYSVDEDNAEAMTGFTANYATSALMGDVLVYMGSHGYFPYIEKTLISLVNNVFVDDANDELLGKLSNYFTEAVRSELFKLLNQRSRYVSNKDYSREISIISVLAMDDSYRSEFEEFSASTLLTQTNSNQNYHPQTLYFDFVAHAIGAIKELLPPTTIDDYANKLITLFPTQRAKCLLAFECLSRKFSKEAFSKVFPLITNGITDAEFEQAFKILRDNNSVRPTESNDLAIFREFLVSHLENAANPNEILQALRNSFGFFSGIKKLVAAAHKNSMTNNDLLLEVIAKSFNGYNEVDRIVREALPMFDDAQEFAVAKAALAKLTTHSLDDVLACASDKLDTSTTIDILVHVAEYAVEHDSIQARDLYRKALTLGLERDNVPDKVVQILHAILKLGKNVRNAAKDEFSEILSSGFTKTMSVSIASEIVRIVKSCGWTRVFKKQIDGNSEKLDQFNKLVK